jgi:hypothetical protein
VRKVTDAEKQKIHNDIISETQTTFEAAGFTSKAIAEELALIAFHDMADFVEVDESGIVRAIPFDQLKNHKSKIIKKIREKRVIRTVKGTKDKPDDEEVLDSTFEFELYDKLEALKFGASGANVSVDRKDLNVSGTVNHDLSPEVQSVFDKIYLKTKVKNDKKRRTSKL